MQQKMIASPRWYWSWIICSPVASANCRKLVRHSIISKQAEKRSTRLVIISESVSSRNNDDGTFTNRDINFHVFRARKLKVRIETLLHEDMSDVSKEHNALWLNHLWEQYVHQIERLRELAPGTINDNI